MRIDRNLMSACRHLVARPFIVIWKMRRFRIFFALVWVILFLMVYMQITSLLFLKDHEGATSEENRFMALSLIASPLLPALENSTQASVSQRVIPLSKPNTNRSLLATPELPRRSCKVPDDWLYPLCRYKVEYLQNNWAKNEACYINRHGLDPKDMCSILVFLSEVEAWCPVLPWRRHHYLVTNKRNKTTIKDLKGLNDKMQSELFKWIRERINRMWPSWNESMKQLLEKDISFEGRNVKNILIFIGSYADGFRWLEAINKGTGVPLGEIVQWSDVIAALYTLGHNLTISLVKGDILKYLNPLKGDTAGCAYKRPKSPLFDIIYTDYMGFFLINKELGPGAFHLRCQIRILDSFGTEAEFNYEHYQTTHNINEPFGHANLLLRQFMTMFPHSPDNLFLGFTVDLPSVPPVSSPLPNRTIALVYGKKKEYWNGMNAYLDVVHKYLEIHATVAGNSANLPSYVKNHGILSGGDLQKLLLQTKVFIGLGFPYEGPAPLEAIAHGSVFLNAKLDPPHNRANTKFFIGKPTLRELTSQHPYMETFVGPPHVYTIDIRDLKKVDDTMKEIMASQVKPYLPHEWTPQGMLERVNAFVENLDFCDVTPPWPPSEKMRLHLGGKGTSCKVTCQDSGLVCEPSYFYNINTISHLNKTGISCESHTTEESLFAPAYNSIKRTCVLQRATLLFSCVGRDPQHLRLCPCRDFQPQQMAFCRDS